MELRKLVTDRIINHLLDSRFYGEYLREFSDSWVAHNQVVVTLSRLNDTLLFAVLTKLLRGDELIPVHADQDGEFCNIKIGRCYGSMVGDGSIHT